jgi:hypothetical protein
MVTLLAQSFFNSSNITEDYLACSKDPPNGQKGLTRGAIATCVILSLLGLLVFTGTVMDLILTSRLKSNRKLPEHGSECKSHQALLNTTSLIMLLAALFGSTYSTSNIYNEEDG